MKTIKKILASLLVVVMVLTAAPLSGFVGLELPDFGIRASALAESGQCGDNVYWTYDYITKEVVVSGTGPMYDCIYYDDSPFHTSNIETLVVEEGVTTIGDYYFRACWNLSNVSLPTTIKSIGIESFGLCDSLQSLILPNGVAKIGREAFYSCDNLKNVTLPNSTVSIGAYAFAYCENLSEIIIPNSVKMIDYHAFYSCNSLSNVIILGTDTVLGDYVFYDCSNLTEITIGVKEIPSQSFQGFKNLKKVTVLDGVEKIGDNAFSDCPHLEIINIPESVNYIGADILKNTAWFNYRGKGLITLDGWIYGYKGADSDIIVNIDDSAKAVAANAFREVDVLEFRVNDLNPHLMDEDGVLFDKDKTILYAYPSGKIDAAYIIPGTVVEIKESAFCLCNSLRKITMGDDISLIGEEAFLGVDDIDVYISNLEKWCKINFKSESSNPIYGYESNLFIDGIMVIDITIPNTITEIKPYSFYNCASLRNITISDSIVSIGDRAFYGCYNLLSLAVADGTTTIGNSAFSGCSKLISVNFSNTVETIGNYCFCDCSNLKSVTFGNNLRKIGEGAFYECISIRDVYYPCTQEDWEKVEIGEDNYYINCSDLYLMHAHEYTSKVTKQVSCTTDGEIIYICKHGDTKIEIIPSTGHNWVDLGGSGKATCITNGVDNFKCSNCGEEKKGEVPALGHDWEYIEHTYATCDEDGYMSRVCLREGCSVKEEKITPASHDLDWWVPKEPTCTEAGEKHIGCMECSYSYVEEIPATGHYFYWDIIKSATCTTTGERKKHCEECNYSSEIEIIPAKGHTYSEWFELLPATCSERGLNIKICDDCNDIQRQIIPKIAHIDADGNGVCDNCESTYKSDATDTPEEPDVPEEPDTPEVPDTPDIPDDPEEEPCDCDCHAGGIKAFFFNFLNFFAKLFNKDARTCECGAAH